MHTVNTLKIYAMGLLFLLLMSGTVFGGTRDPKIADQHYVEYGKKFKSVVRIRAVGKAGEKHYASAVLIKPHWALTAGHILHETTAPHILMDNDTRQLPLQTVIIHKGFTEDPIKGFPDLAVVYSAQDFGLDFYTPLYKQKDEEGKVATLAGCGLNGTFETGHAFSDVLRRAGSNRVERASDSVLFCTPSRDASDGKTSMEFLIAPGDSGGGLFIGNELAGIHSFISRPGSAPNSKYGEESGHTRISLYADWVESQIAEHELKLKAVEK